VPSDDGQAVYYFDSGGRQIETRDADSDDLIYSFGYTQGWLSSITDRFGKQTKIVRDDAGHLKQIVAPFGQTTTISTDGSGQISRVEAPDSTKYDFTYDDKGMLSTLTNPRGYTSHYVFDAKGRLTTDSDAAGGGMTIEHDSAEATAVLVTTAENVQSSHGFARGTSGLSREVTLPSGATNQSLQSAKGQSLVTLGDGTTVATTRAADPIWGMMAPFTAQSTITYPSGRSSQSTVTVPPHQSTRRSRLAQSTGRRRRSSTG
jgi:YD repeat-containing protein